MPGHQDDKVRDDAHQNLKKVLKAPVTLFGLLMKRVNNDFGSQVKKLDQEPVRVTNFDPQRLNRRSRKVLEIQCNDNFGSGAHGGGRGMAISIQHAGGTFPAKALFPVIAGIVAPKSSWVDGLGESFRKNLPITADEVLDCGCALDDGAFDSFEGELRVLPGDGALIHFLFRLLSKLQSLGSVPAIDWAAYAAIIAPH